MLPCLVEASTLAECRCFFIVVCSAPLGLVVTVALDELSMCVHVKERPNVNALVFVSYEGDH